MSIKIIFEAEDKASRKAKQITDKTERELKQLRREADKTSKEMQTGWQKANKAMSDLHKNIGPVGYAIAGMAAGAAYAVGRLIASSITAASDLQEVENKYKVVFRGVEDIAKDTTDKLTEDFGFSRESVYGWMSQIQDTLVPMGLARDEAAALSGKITQLAVDVGSFNNQPTADVIRDINSALVGNHETVKKYGIVINETVLAQEAMNQGLKKQYKDLTEQEKLMLRYSVIVRGSADAQGDFARTSGGFANQTRILDERWKEFNATLGEQFIPMMEDDMIPLLTKATGAATSMAENLAFSLKASFAISTGNVQMLGELIQKTEEAGISFIGMGEAARSSVLPTLEEIEGTIAVIPEDVEQINTGLEAQVNIQGHVRDVLDDQLDRRQKQKDLEEKSRATEQDILRIEGLQTEEQKRQAKKQKEYKDAQDKALQGLMGINASSHTFVGQLQSAVGMARQLYDTFNAINSIFGFLSFLPWFHTGGFVSDKWPKGGYAPPGTQRFMGGGYAGGVQLGPNERLARLEVGELVLTRQQQAALGIGQGGRGGGTVNVHIDTIIGNEQYVYDTVVPALKKAATELRMEVWSSNSIRAKRLGD